MRNTQTNIFISKLFLISVLNQPGDGLFRNKKRGAWPLFDG